MNHGERLSRDEVDRVTHRALVRAFDYGAAAFFGATAATAAWAVVPPSWPMMAEMIVGMAVGVMCAVPLLGLVSLILGGFEVVMLAMQVGMFAGMIGAMTTSGRVTDVAFEGILVGIMVQVWLHVVDRSLSGEVRSDG